MGRVLGRYVRRPEHKSLAPDGSAASPDTRGLLRRRPVRARPTGTMLIGKEARPLLFVQSSYSDSPAASRASAWVR